MTEPRFHPEAEAEYQEALAWYFDQSPELAERFEAAVQRALDDICRYPRRWPMKDSRHRIRPVVRFQYAIIYRQEGESVIIVAVAHSRRDPDHWRHRLDDASTNGRDD